MRQAGVIVFQFVHAFKREAKRTLGAVDFERVVVFVTGCLTSGFVGSDCSVGVANQERDGVVNGNVFVLVSRVGAGFNQFVLRDSRAGSANENLALFDEGFRVSAADFFDFYAGNETGDVNDVSVEVAMSA